MKSILLICIIASLYAGYCETLEWEKIDNGLDFIQLEYSKYTKVNVLKIDPDLYNFDLYMASEHDGRLETSRDIVEKDELICAFNAGMYDVDMVSNVGYMKHYKHINNSRINSRFYSFAAFNPVNSSSKAFEIFDKDIDDIDKVLEEYNTVFQNLRLIKTPAVNVWEDSSESWPELALGKDYDGNVLIIFCTTSLHMQDLNNFLLTEALGITAAQHLDGNAPASLYFEYKGRTIQYMGSHLKIDEQGDFDFFEIPNIIGVSKK